ncbi:MENG [Trypanosoma equiperdum]|uniref:Cilia- and flagella-associated protein 58 central coiled coil domain-containing protein n=4 Tax=Trypanozoon TaxID=39700 RepID=Q383I9_TRYB2|nr:hypothetical protein, conserved [Trypanosoma brucei gambiense DAL972]XP_829154.1 hypothetical protein, conserved [Trypanosoma brucei brucei TREU927]RHW68469.1 Component of motile flagella 9 [Trypanosoma brucei equiperdum]SCU68571.1 MENG [Trypanosoma equiperdum]EAN80042.1 hypothetical protein, conserved [Trypanosoma brucei brucei TREU927]CBH18102.1 hypothetical protein, conserved [Trypanosoma brucei gambiense DAL972]|eukprot:XP_011780366.1 hypothetical protein, conserved [Trypanosoma brucei gambiense DAL972]
MENGKNDEFTVSDEAVENLQKDFEEAMAALAEHESFDRFRMEYDVLYRALRKSHDSEKRLVKRCQQLTQELMSNAAKVQAALKLSQSDHTTIDALKKEIEKAWRMVDSANEKDAHAKETMKNLKEEVASLQEIMANGAELTSSQSATLEGLKLEKKRMEMEYGELVKQMDNLTKEIKELNTKSKELEVEIMNNQEEFKRVTDRETLIQQEYDKEIKARERADFQVKEQLHLAQQRAKELKTHEQLRINLTETVTKLRAQVQEDNEKRQLLEQKIETAEKQLYHTQQSYDDAVDTTEALNERHRAVCKEIAEAEKMAHDLLSEEERTRAVCDGDYKKLRRLIQQNDDVRQEYENLTRQQSNIQKRINTVKKERHAMNNAYEVLQKEQDTLKKYGEHERKKLQTIEGIIANEVESQKDVEAAIEREREISVRLSKTIAKLESEREKYTAEVLQAVEQHALVKEDLKVATITCNETQKAIEESEQRLKKQQGLYEQARAERNLYTKKLIESQDEVMELKQGFRMMDHQIRQLKEELAMKEKKFQDETSAQKIAKEKLAKVRRVVNERTIALDDTIRNCENVAQNIKQLVKVVNECDKQLSEQRQMFLSVSNERDMLGTQLIRRNDELALLYEKIRMQQEVLSRGYAACRARQEDMRLLRLKTEDLKRQAKIADRRAQDTKQLQEDIKQLVYDLTVQRAKVQALTEEAENPKSSLRWEKVDGRNPTAEELNRKIFRLQRRLITKSEECVEKDMELQEKQRLLTELTNILARQPGPEVVQRLNMCQKELHRTCSVMKQKASELNMTGTHFAELKYEAERLRREVNDTRRKYYEMRMSNDELTKAMEASRSIKS